jgi:hypothetical protein
MLRSIPLTTPRGEALHALARPPAKPGGRHRPARRETIRRGNRKERTNGLAGLGLDSSVTYFRPNASKGQTKRSKHGNGEPL